MARRVTTLSCLCLLVLAFSMPSFAQIQVEGRVTEAESGFPLPGVNIAVKGTQTGTTSDMDGAFAISVPGPDAVLVFSFVGFVTQEVLVGDQTHIVVALRQDVAQLDDVVVVGYGTQRREAVTGSVASISGDDANLGLVTNPNNMIQGRVAGVTITQNNGEPGAGFNVRVRGGTSISASNEPLYVVDGVPIDNVRTEPEGVGVSSAPPRNALNMLNASDIESIDILKDASATAIYGSRGANGVILITTKQGQAGQVTVDYDGYVAGSQASRRLDLLSASEYRAFMQDLVDQGRLGQQQLDALGSGDTDWQDEMFQTGVSQFHNLAVAGGAQNTQYRASVSYLDQEGHIIDSGLERVTGRLNANHQTLNNRLRLGLNLTSSFVKNDYLPYEEAPGFQGGVILNMLGFNPTYPVTTGESFFEIPGDQTNRNPVAMARQIDDVGRTTRTLGNLSADLDLFKGLTARVNVGADRAQANRSVYFPASNPIGAVTNGQALKRNRERGSITFQSYLTYNADVASNQNVEILGGYEFNEYTIEEFGAETQNFVTDFWKFNNLAGGKETIKPYSLQEKSRLVSFFGRVNYDAMGKYLLSASLRQDGSSRFGAENKWGLFPAVSVGWRLSSEPFMQSVSWLSELKLRAGYGVNGSQEIGNYRSLALLAPDPGARAVIGDDVITGVAPTTFANPDLQWEETRSFNVGVDYGFLANRFSGTVEYYVKNTDNLLLEIPVPQPAVVETRLENIGEIRNRGLEFSLNALAVDRRDLSVIVGAVFAAEDNEVVNLGDRERIITGTVHGRGQSGETSQIIIPGHAVPTFYGHIFEGFDENGVQQFRDLNGDGEINADDRTFIGNPRPDFTYGLNSQVYWGNFDMHVLLRGEQGRDVLNNTALIFRAKSSSRQNQNTISDALADPDDFDEAAKFSSRWIEDGSFLRLQNVTLGYTLDARRLSSHIRKARIYASADNLFILTSYDGYDPEVQNNSKDIASIGIDWVPYPSRRTFTVGVNLGF